MQAARARRSATAPLALLLVHAQVSLQLVRPVHPAGLSFSGGWGVNVEEGGAGWTNLLFDQVPSRPPSHM